MAKHWRIFWALAVGVVLTPLDSSMVSAVLPVITRDLSTTLPVSQWVLLGYLLGACCLVLPSGRLGDGWGLRRLYLIGIGWFLLGSLLCAVAPNITVLIAARGLESMGAAMLHAMGPALIARTFPAEERGRGIGMLSAVVYLAISIGPGIGGLLAEVVGWRGVFAVNLPVGAVAFVLGTTIIPSDERPAARPPFDGLGAVALAGTLFPLLLVLSRGNAWGWATGRTLAAAGVAGVLGLAFVARQARAPAPLLDLALFRDRLFAAATASSVLNYAGMYAIALLTPFYLIQVRGFAPSLAGSLLMAMPVTMTVGAPWTGWVSDRVGSRQLASAGMAVLTGGLLWLRTVDGATGPAGIVFRLAVAGLGLALFTAPNASALMGAVPARDQGLAGGVVATARQLGMGIGVAVSGAVFSGRSAAYRARGWDGLAAGLGGYADGLAAAAGLTALGIVTSLLRGHSPRRAQSPQR